MNYVRIKISGINLVRIIDKLVEKNVLINNVVLKKTILKFSINEKDIQILDKICKTEKKFYKIIYKNGLKQLFYNLPYAFSTIIVVLIYAIYFYCSSLFISSVNVCFKSNSSYDISAVQNLLATNGVVSGAVKKDNKISDIKNLIMLNIDSVEDCVVEYAGRNLNITIFPATLKNENKTDNIYALYDGVVEIAEVYKGDLKVKVGDIVKKGDLLIENNNGASGKVVGKVYFSATKIYNENQQEIVYSGKEYIVNDYGICNKILIFGKNQCNFSNYLVEKCSFFINKNLFLPVFCQQTKYLEIEIINKTIPFSEVCEKIKEQAFLEAKQNVLDDSLISNVTYSIVSEDNYTRVDCFIETKINLF